MPTMIEKVAEVLYRLHNPNSKLKLSEFSNSSLHKLMYIRDAKAAIEAMKEPTEEMILSIYTAETNQERKNNWQAMINAALEGK